MELRQQFEILVTPAAGPTVSFQKFDGFGEVVQPKAEGLFERLRTAADAGDTSVWAVTEWQTITLLGPNGYTRRWARIV